MKKTIRNKNNKSKNNKSKNNKSKNNKSNKITYILDLDQTLLHSEFNNKELNNNHKVYYRPYLKKLTLLLLLVLTASGNVLSLSSFCRFSNFVVSIVF